MVEDAGRVMRVGRNTTYELVRCGPFRSARAGKHIRIPTQAIIEYLGQFIR